MTAVSTPPVVARPRGLRLHRTFGTRGGIVGAAILLVLVIVALAAPLLAPHGPEEIDATRVLAGPSAAHPFGSDALGRDVLSRVLFAFRASLGVFRCFRKHLDLQVTEFGVEVFGRHRLNQNSLID